MSLVTRPPVVLPLLRHRLAGRWPFEWIWAILLSLLPEYCSAQESTGAAFSLALDRMVSVSRGEAPLQDVLEDLARAQNTRILLDRRLDPEQLVLADLRRMRLRTLIGQLAGQSRAGLSILADTIYIGPPETVRILRTLAEVRGMELREAEQQVGKRIFQFLRREKLAWEDLTEPRELVRRLCQRYELGVVDLELIPHDLWRSGSIQNPNVTEALVLLLLQFDLAFAWEPDFQGIRIIPAPNSITLPRLHAPGMMGLQQAEALIRDTFPDLEIVAVDRQLRVVATLEEHEAIEALLGRKPQAGPNSREAVNLVRQRFSLRAQGAPASQILESLQLDGVTIEMNADQLGERGIDLEHKVTLELNQATAQELMTALSAQVGFRYRIERNTITLLPPASDQ